MAVPYDLYLRFLATKNVVDVRLVNEKLAELSLPPVTQDAFYAQYAKLKATLPKGVFTQIEEGSYSADFLRWMRVLEVEDLWFAEKGFVDPAKRPVIRLAYDIHQDLQVRLAIDALLIKGVPPKDVVSSLRARFSTLLKDEHVDLYRRFFFDPSRMTRRDWRSYLELLEAEEQRIVFLALSAPADVVKTELELPAKVAVSDMLQTLLAKTYQKAKTYLAQSGKESNDEARRFTSLVMELADKYEKYRSGDSTDFGNALQMEFDFVDAGDFPTPDAETLKELQAEIKAKETRSKAGEKEGADEACLFDEAAKAEPEGSEPVCY